MRRTSGTGGPSRQQRQRARARHLIDQYEAHPSAPGKGPGLGSVVKAVQGGLEGLGLSGAAHPVRRLHHPGGAMMLPTLGGRGGPLVRGLPEEMPLSRESVLRAAERAAAEAPEQKAAQAKLERLLEEAGGDWNKVKIGTRGDLWREAGLKAFMITGAKAGPYGAAALGYWLHGRHKEGQGVTEDEARNGYLSDVGHLQRTGGRSPGQRLRGRAGGRRSPGRTFPMGSSYRLAVSSFAVSTGSRN